MSFLSPSPSSSMQHAIAQTDCNVPSPGNDGISSLRWSPVANYLVSSNWDGSIRCWEIHEQGGQILAQPRAQVNHENQAPVLSTCFSPDGSTIFSGGCDKAVRMWQRGQPTPSNNIPQQIGAHDAPVKNVGFLRSSNIVVSGGWDAKLKFWDTRQPSPALVLDVGERVYDFDVRDNLLVVATADRQIIAYDCSSTPQERMRKESPLKFQSRCISCFVDATGFAVGSIEGRVGIHYLNKPEDNFSFRCHRKDSSVYAVNAIAFHNQFGTFATVGSDGAVNFWDKDNRRLLKAFGPIQRTVPCANFNTQGNLFAYASSYDWSKGSSNVQPGNEVFVHLVGDEIRPKVSPQKSY